MKDREILKILKQNNEILHQNNKLLELATKALNIIETNSEEDRKIDVEKTKAYNQTAQKFMKYYVTGFVIVVCFIVFCMYYVF